MNRKDFTSLDVNRLFEEHSVEEIIEIEKLLANEFERKRNDLRSMVGDRYKDILAASDAIKSMKTISENIVSNIEEITKTCETMVESPIPNLSSIATDSRSERDKTEERVLLIQVRLAIFLNEQIWIALDSARNLDATQYFLLAQHIYMGLNLTKKESLGRLPLLDYLKMNLSTLRAKILEKVTEKLESVEITSEETSHNLNALMLLEGQTTDELLNIFIQHRKTALQTLINTQYSGVRVQIAAMVKCLMTTVLLLHDCFIYNNKKNGLLWQGLHNIVGENAPATISKLTLPTTPLVTYMPEIIQNFKPKLQVKESSSQNKVSQMVIGNWLKSTQENIEKGLEESLQLVTTVKGLYLIREESLKIDIPDQWASVCRDLQLPDDFHIWYYFFQNVITLRAKTLITITIKESISDFKSYVNVILKNKSKIIDQELDLRSYAWKESNKVEDNHADLTMKTKGFSKNVVNMCKEFDKKFLILLEDVSQYLYGQEYTPNAPYWINDYKFKRKFIDREALEVHLMGECSTQSLEIPIFIGNTVSSESVAKSLLLARFLQASCDICQSFQKCCQYGSTTSQWTKVCDAFIKTAHALWDNWLSYILKLVEGDLNALTIPNTKELVNHLFKWDEIEIQEQTEEKVFKSQIKVPLKPSIPLTNVLVKLNLEITKILPFTLPRSVHIKCIEAIVDLVLKKYDQISSLNELNQIQALQLLLDVKFVTTLCVPRENGHMITVSQTVCDKLRAKIDPFDLDVFYTYLQNNVKKSISQSQTIFGCLLPSSSQLLNLGSYTKSREQEKSPSLMALSTPSVSGWFPLLPITVPSQKLPGSLASKQEPTDQKPKSSKRSPKRPQEPLSVRQSAASLFGNFSTDWFS